MPAALARGLDDELELVEAKGALLRYLLMRDLGDRDKARDLYRRAVSICQARLPPQHPALARVSQNLAQLELTL